jgi:hypothetical protein
MGRGWKRTENPSMSGMAIFQQSFWDGCRTSGRSPQRGDFIDPIDSLTAGVPSQVVKASFPENEGFCEYGHGMRFSNP